MTTYIADIASYQGGITPSPLLAAGFTAVNVKTSHGMGQRSVHPDAKSWLNDPRFTRSTFHWLTGDATGSAQAGYAYTRLAELGATQNCAHVVDVEDSGVTKQIFEDYIFSIATLLKRPIAVYTGDWFAVGRSWLKASIYAPWLWAAPDSGYLDFYPGDDSAHWLTYYGGWSNLSVMQYRVAKIDGVDVSQSAVRDPSIWAEIRGIVVPWVKIPAIESLFDEFDEAFPRRDKASDGSKGNDAHAETSSDHNPDESGNTPYEDSDGVDEVHAADIDADLNHPDWTMERLLQTVLLPRVRSGIEKRVRYYIYNRHIWSASWGWTEHDYTGGNPHDKHLHASFYYGSGSGISNPENVTTSWGILEAVKEEEAMGFIETQEEFEAAFDKAMTKWASNRRIRRYDSKGQPIPEAADGSHNMSVLSALNYIGRDTIMTKYGTSPAELNDATRDSALQVAVKTISDALGQGGQNVDAQALAEALAPLLPTIDGNDIYEAFRRAFSVPEGSIKPSI